MDADFTFITDVKAYRGRASKLGAHPSFDTPDHFLKSFREASTPEKLDLLAQMKPAMKISVAPGVPDILLEETDGIVSGALIKTFSSLWPHDRLEDLCRHLHTQTVHIQASALDILAAKAPNLLLEHLPHLLTSEEPRTRAAAFRALTKIDLEEAIGHLESFLLSPDPELKYIGLQNCYCFPFESIMPLLFKFLAAEHDPHLIESVGLLLASNPNQEIPANLYEIMELAEPQKAGALKKILSGACNALEKSGILGDQYKPFMERLQKWIHQRAASRFVQECVTRFTSGEPLTPEFEASLSRQIAKALIREAFQEALNWPISNQAKEMIRALVGTPTPGPADTPPAASAQEAQPKPVSRPLQAETPFANLTADEKIRRIATWQVEDKAKVKPFLDQIFQDQNSPYDLIGSSFRAAARLDLKTYVDRAREILQVNHPVATAAAIEYLGMFDPEYLFPYIGRFIQSEALHIKVAALHILKRNDIAQAISLLRTLLFSKNPEQKNSALSCIVHFDFHLVRDMLLEFLMTNPETATFQAGLCLFQANLDPENLYALYQLEKKVPPASSQMAREARVAAGKHMLNLGVLDPDRLRALEASFEKKVVQETSKKQAPPPAYSVRAIKSQEAKKPPESPHPLANVQEWFEKNRKEIMVALAGTTVFLLLLVLLSFRGGGEPAEPGEGRALSGQPINVSGTITKLLPKSEEAVITTKNGTKYIIPVPDSASPPQEGMPVKASLVPFRELDDGTVLARLITLSRQ